MGIDEGFAQNLQASTNAQHPPATLGMRHHCLIQALQSQADAWRATELARARKLLAKGEDVEAVLEALSRGLTQKMLHGALAELHSADPHHRPQVAETVSRLFLRGEVTPERRS